MSDEIVEKLVLDGSQYMAGIDQAIHTEFPSECDERHDADKAEEH